MNKLPKNNNTNLTGTTKQICKLGLDVHAASITVARQLDGAQPQPPQKMAVAKFLPWVQSQLQKGYRVISCYEAGPTGFWLHRQLEQLGVTNYVVCPSPLDSRAKRVNNDQTDARELLVRLDRYVAGNRHAFSMVQVPTPAQEQKRAVVRQRDELRRKRLALAARGRMLLLGQGYRQSNQWWQPGRWELLRLQLADWLVELLSALRRLIESIHQEVSALERQIIQAAPAHLPKGLGRLTHEVIESEIKDFAHFHTRRQMGSYSGLTGGVSSSGAQHADLSITKAGNRRLRTAAIEWAWRMLIHQPGYWLVRKWRPVLLNPKVHARRRKQALVAFARQLLIDLWKWKTGRTTPQALGWTMT